MVKLIYTDKMVYTTIYPSLIYSVRYYSGKSVAYDICVSKMGKTGYWLTSASQLA